jgi:hypothetical protein
VALHSFAWRVHSRDGAARLFSEFDEGRYGCQQGK